MPEGYESLYLNPAGLVFETRARLSVGGTHARFFLDQSEGNARAEPVWVTVVGISTPLPLGGVLANRLAFGLGFSLPNSALARSRAPLDGAPFFSLLESRGHVVGVLGGLGLRITDEWQVGLSTLSLAALEGTIDLVSDTVSISTKSEQRLVSDFAILFGGLYRPEGARYQIGATFRQESKSDYNVAIRTALGDDLPLNLPKLRVAGTAQYDPLTLAIEGAYQISPALRGALQFAYRRWSEFPAPIRAPVDNLVTPSPDFHDTVEPRVGIEFDAAQWLRLRAGYGFVLSPAPEMTGLQNYLDNHRHVGSFGFGLRLWSVTIDAWAQAHALVSRTHEKDPNLFEEEGPPFSEIRTSGNVVAGGLTMGVEL